MFLEPEGGLLGKFDRVWIGSENYDNSIVIWDRVTDRDAQLEGDGVQFLGGKGDFRN